MGESVSPWTPSCNGSIRVELDGQRATSDSGALLLREALDNSGVIDALEDNLVDRRDPQRVRHSLASQLRTVVLQRAMGWIDLTICCCTAFSWSPTSASSTGRRRRSWRSRKRGSAEAHMGEVKSALDVHLSSTDRGSSTVQDVMDRNEMSLLLSLYAYQVLHGLRCLLEHQTQRG